MVKNWHLKSFFLILRNKFNHVENENFTLKSMYVNKLYGMWICIYEKYSLYFYFIYIFFIVYIVFFCIVRLYIVKIYTKHIIPKSNILYGSFWYKFFSGFIKYTRKRFVFTYSSCSFVLAWFFLYIFKL